MATRYDRAATDDQAHVTARPAAGPIASPLREKQDKLAATPDQGATTTITPRKGTRLIA